MPFARRHAAGFTLVEVFIVLTIMGILAGLLIPSFEPNSASRLQSTADVVAADIALVRSLAVVNGSTYEMTFDVRDNEYFYEHTGANAALNILPVTPFADYEDTLTRRTVYLDEIPTVGPPARLVNLYKTFDVGLPQAVTTLEFGPLGETTRTEPTVIWIAVGRGTARRLQSITVDPVTGLTTIGEVNNVLPSGMVVADESAPASS